MMKQQETGNTIKTLREKKGYTQKQLADLLFLSDKTVSKWETGKGIPDVSLLEPLAKVLGVSVGELLRGEPTENRNRCGNMLKGHFYRCPMCGNLNYSAGEGAFSCCGNTLLPLLAQKAPEGEHLLKVQKMEQDYYVHLQHPMTKEHYIMWIALETDDELILKQLKPEDEPKAEFVVDENKKITAFAYCNLHSLWKN